MPRDYCKLTNILLIRITLKIINSLYYDIMKYIIEPLRELCTTIGGDSGEEEPIPFVLSLRD